MLRVLFLILALGISMNSFAKDIFIHSHNTNSNRFAIFEDNEETAFLYLTEAGTQRPIKDAVAYSRKPLVEKVDWEKIKESGDTQPLPKDIASSSAVIESPNEAEFSFRWSADGNAIALLRNGTPIAFVATTEKYGFSKAVSKPSPLANPWNQQRYESTFGK